ncbi:MAG TPA: 4-hydroxy-tetrahydrodipicolinate reductase [Rhodanobacteraceae bacterium]|nr:4-hydroxy-tetrahydrodipicolinate reductase [Rhodanobacteraceae bacterium]
MSKPIPIAVHGAAGRMGRAILRLAAENPALRIAAAVVKEGSPLRGVVLRESPEAGENIAYSDSLDAASDAAVLIDFSVAPAFDAALDFARSRRIAFVSGTTGLSPAQRHMVQNAAAEIPLIWSANFSLGVAVLSRLVRDAAKWLPDWDCEIAEAHHRGKKDAPSGTALLLGRAVADARGVDFDRAARMSHADGAREAGSIGFASLRAGDIVGEHAVMLAGDGERIELVHRAGDRDVFARGALAAARWIAGRAPGLYGLDEVLGIERA